jgi:GNAT superfamily N-acetyltransferase
VTSAFARQATAEDASAVAAILAAAFHDDPVWGPWTFPDATVRGQLSLPFWRFFVDASIPNGWVWLTSGNEATSVWVPPGTAELPPPFEERLQPFLVELLGARADTIYRGFECFDEAHPHHEPHFYLSLLATDPTHRGHGFGMALLSANLQEIDRQGMPAYLESTNPANNRRYEGQGFAAIGAFRVPDGPEVTTMWRQRAGAVRG